MHFSISLCTKASRTHKHVDVVALKVNFSKFSKLFFQTYKTYSSLMKQSYRFERFLLSSVDDISVQLRFRELNDTQRGGWIGVWKSVDPCYFLAQIRRSVAIFVQESGSAWRKVILWYTFITMKGKCFFFPLDALGERNVGLAVNL